MTRTNADIDNLLNRRLHLIEQAARSLCAHRADELTWEIIPLWYTRYLKNPGKWWGILANGDEYEVIADMRQLGKRVLEWWVRCERDESLTDDLLCNPVEWGDCNVKLRYENGVGEYAARSYVASDADLQTLFDAVARHNMTDEHGTGLGRVESADLMSAFQAVKPAIAHAIRLLASGFAVGEMSNREAYRQVAGVLQSAL